MVDRQASRRHPYIRTFYEIAQTVRTPSSYATPCRILTAQNRRVGKSSFRNGGTAYRAIDSSGDSLKILGVQRLSRSMKDRSLQPPLTLDLILDAHARVSRIPPVPAVPMLSQSDEYASGATMCPLPSPKFSETVFKRF